MFPGSEYHCRVASATASSGRADVMLLTWRAARDRRTRVRPHTPHRLFHQFHLYYTQNSIDHLTLGNPHLFMYRLMLPFGVASRKVFLGSRINCITL